MARLRYLASLGLVSLIVQSAALGCTPGSVGDPCVPEDESNANFSGFGEAEANVESQSFQCETRVCIVNHFRGRVSCPYGQTEDDKGRCLTPGSNAEVVNVAVDPQLLDRRAKDAVYCSCRCAGPDKSAKYCECPSGYSCSPLVPDLGFDREQLVGSYCIKNGTEHTGNTNGSSCSLEVGNCPSN